METLPIVCDVALTGAGFDKLLKNFPIDSRFFGKRHPFRSGKYVHQNHRLLRKLGRGSAAHGAHMKNMLGRGCQQGTALLEVSFLTADHEAKCFVFRAGGATAHLRIDNSDALRQSGFSKRFDRSWMDRAVDRDYGSGGSRG